ncbi:MAG TPA: hypothetical protein VLG44_08720 [Chlamydiales bacterium]|nr:hypothetical protein [Chlamydiales bacterium]
MSTGRSLFFRTKSFLFKDQISFFRFDPLLAAAYSIWGFFQNPYRACRKAHLGVYGETPLKVYQEIANEIHPEDHYVELGSGRGKGCFWINRLANCKVTGIELHRGFYFGSYLLQKIFRKKGISFMRRDFLNTDLSASFIYIYGTCLSEYEIQLLSSKIPIGSKTASVSFSFAELFPKEWEVSKILTVQFPWGMTNIYIESKKVRIRCRIPLLS